MAIRRTVFTSDTHFLARIFTRDREKLFEDFLRRYIDSDVDALYILGDAFDPLMGDWGRLRKERRLVRALNETGEKLNKRFELLPGNHDIAISNPEYRFGQTFPYLTLHPPRIQHVIVRERVGDVTTPKRSIRTLGSGTEANIYGFDARMAHGYEADPYFSPDPQRLDFLIRLGGVLDQIMGPVVGGDVSGAWDRLYERMGNVTRQLGTFRVRGTSEKLLLAARDMAEYATEGENVVKMPSPYHFVFLGHTHTPEMQELYDDVLQRQNPLGSVYVNTGTWTRTSRRKGSDFAVLHEDGCAELCKWVDGAPQVHARYESGHLEKYRWEGKRREMVYEVDIPLLPRV